MLVSETIYAFSEQPRQPGCVLRNELLAVYKSVWSGEKASENTRGQERGGRVVVAVCKKISRLIAYNRNEPPHVGQTKRKCDRHELLEMSVKMASNVFVEICSFVAYYKSCVVHGLS